MKCPECGSWQVEVRDSRELDRYRRRRYFCPSCETKFSTYEVVVTVDRKEVKRER